MPCRFVKPYGVWGGLTEAERELLYGEPTNAQATPSPPHPEARRAET